MTTGAPFPPPGPYPPPYPYPYPYPSPYAAPGPPTPPRSDRTEGFAVAGFLLALVGFVLVAVPFSIAALGRIRREGSRGRGLAVSGLVISGVWVLGLVGLIALGVASGASRDDTGAVTAPGTVTAVDLRAGDCLRTIPDGSTVTDVDVVPCGEPHAGEVYGVFDLPPGAYPGVDAVSELARTRCDQEIGRYAPPAAKEQVSTYLLYPLAENWTRGDREITCVAESDPPAPGSIRDAGRWI